MNLPFFAKSPRAPRLSFVLSCGFIQGFLQTSLEYGLSHLQKITEKSSIRHLSIRPASSFMLIPDQASRTESGITFAPKLWRLGAWAPAHHHDINDPSLTLQTIEGSCAAAGFSMDPRSTIISTNQSINQSKNSIH